MRAERHPWLTTFAVLSIAAGILFIVISVFYADAFFADMDPSRAAWMGWGLVIIGAMSIGGSLYALIASAGFKHWEGLQGYQKGIALLCMLPGLVLAGALAIVWISVTNKRRSR